MLTQDTDASRRDPNEKSTHSLIASDRVEGTRVYGADGKHIGSIERLIIGKLDGRVAYAVLSFGGFLGIGHDHYPLPWEKLNYDTQLDGYRIDLTKEQIEGAPSYADDDDSWYNDNGRRVYDYYGVPPYWM
ncbi:photosystem reaction center subunit H [Rhizobium leguminosarum bv. trifolii CB782]|uniref:PRC-barrel domain-containing protein n=1 Tax=Rhizobium hidalgonense TaxID=1538159 RepID=A0A2A6KGX9_9HYPH|nr:PRC-barrel domain-containing protein [Rhizobium hidalgonense]AHG43895.1 photosystem reaction center subunit H [Rhizobium leguminosarum bv. trifolii CB782]EJC74431.1 PRC-barrel protein [Rhizobium leguminosarum bv. trifolii WSM2012]MDR9774064.1 PRC-barrel domain-containing protein [Rhizobium hidalgonense]MDR9804652.1 PRC-barrel domain-containing protein [Rhizobium hidalgonense]MDR9812178.1 PRC-barrel domain-containing protein [Rhizobium hidalgonense]